MININDDPKKKKWKWVYRSWYNWRMSKKYKGRPTCFNFILSLLSLSYVWVEKLLFVVEDIIFEFNIYEDIN